MIQTLKSKQFFAFIITGGIAALVNFCSRLFYNQWVDFSSAIIVAYITGMVSAFILARTFVFTSSSQVLHRSIAYFILVNLVAVIQTWVISMALAQYVFPNLNFQIYPKEIAHFIGITIPVFTSYFGHKYFSFKGS